MPPLYEEEEEEEEEGHTFPVRRTTLFSMGFFSTLQNAPSFANDENL